MPVVNWHTGTATPLAPTSSALVDLSRTGSCGSDARARCFWPPELVRVAALELGAEADLGEERPTQIDGSPLLLSRDLLSQGWPHRRHVAVTVVVGVEGVTMTGEPRCVA